MREQQDPISGFLPPKQLIDVDTLAVGRGGTTAYKQLDESATMTALAANMCLAVCKSLGKENTALFVSMGQSMMDMLQKAGPLSLVNSNINQGNNSMILHTVNSIFDFAQQVCRKSFLIPYYSSSTLRVNRLTNLCDTHPSTESTDGQDQSW